jgi:protein-tyrosine phosphatase
MIDIHCHMLYGVDDGPEQMEESIAMLQEAAAQGITDVILTPHYRRGMFKFDKERTIAHRDALQDRATEVGIRLHLGTEVHINRDVIEYLQEGKCLSLANSEYVLAEYEYTSEYSYILQMTQELLRYGYIPVIAHVERYGCLVKEPERLEELRKIGALTQINAAAVIGKDGFAAKQYCKRILKNGWVDIIASDSHGMHKRTCYMAQCYDYINRKYGEKLANRLMIKNPRKIIGE